MVLKGSFRAAFLERPGLNCLKGSENLTKKAPGLDRAGAHTLSRMEQGAADKAIMQV